MFQPWTIPAPLVPLFVALVGIGSFVALRSALWTASDIKRRLKVWRDRRRANRPWRPHRQPRMAKRLPR